LIPTFRDSPSWESGSPKTSRLYRTAAASRARDVFDILLIDSLGELNYSETAAAALRVLEQRATHAFPPAFIMPGEWHSELETLAGELDFPIKSSAEIEKRFREIIRELGRIALG
jgi:hypothetical protein